MNEKTNIICFVIATKDRPKELRKTLKSLSEQTIKPYEVVVVDGGEKRVENICKNIQRLNIRYLNHRPPSASIQRNIGIGIVNKDCDFIGILDDDIVLKEKAVEFMMAFWKTADKNVGGAAFNLMNHPAIYAEKYKTMRVTEKLGLYSKKGGKVTDAGFQTLIGNVKRNKFVDWLPSTAVIYSKRVFEDFLFDEWYKGYSYLEDLDFSYLVGKKYKLAVVADAGYFHYPAPWGRGSGYEFGVREVLNRIYFIKKHKELSILKCFMALKIRQFMSIWLFLKEKKFYFLSRAFGNSVGFVKSIIQNK